MNNDTPDFLHDINESLKYALKNKNWNEIRDVIDMINDELQVEEKVEYVSSRDREDELMEEDND